MIDLKIGRNTYKITESDTFMYNRSCVQLLTQSKEKISWGKKSNPVLSKMAIKQMSKFERFQHKHTFSDNVQVFNFVDV